jgi:hypothetical protein
MMAFGTPLDGLLIVVGAFAVLYVGVRAASAAYFASKKHFLKEMGYGIRQVEVKEKV